ncbi:MAG: hypothetical protein CMG55_03530 [Candidatus Marinimicrobia bacterium]|nr:hypothetical protein [Candidatus Neomarinimicrobiota bacterium]|tara:strand:+ start:2242 stop:2652 length:411 start_codon:yes stop_codon:yes gene_type:complete
MIEEIQGITSTKKELRGFGITIGIIFLLITGFLFFKEKESFQIFLYIGGFFIALGLILPRILNPFYLIWMTFAVIFGWVMTRLILSILFYSLITAIGFLARIFGKDFLNLKSTDYESYWNLRDRERELNQDYEKQY